MSQEVRFTLIGAGSIGRNLLDILIHRGAAIESDYGLKFVLVGAADSGGAAIDPAGLDMVAVRDLKLAGEGMRDYAGRGRARMTALEMISRVPSDIVVDAAPTNLRDGEPGLSCIRAALRAKRHVVMADKGPLVLAFAELVNLAREMGARLLYSGTVAGGLPTVNIGVRDLAGSAVQRVDGLFNETSNYILTRMEEERIPYEDALRAAQEAGIAEADPSLDVEGWDAAGKLVIIANSALRHPATLADVDITGIRGLRLEDLLRARSQGKVIKPLAIAERRGSGYLLRVAPVALDEDHPLARLGRWEMGVVYHTDCMGAISAIIEEMGPVPTSAAVLRDMINVFTAH